MTLKDLIFQWVSPNFQSAIEGALKELIEQKHLYQNLGVNQPSIDQLKDFVIPKIAQLEREKITPPFKFPEPEWFPHLEEACEHHVSLPWRLQEVSSGGRRGRVTIDETERGTTRTEIVIQPPSVKLFCGQCQDTEPFNFSYGSDFLTVTSTAPSKLVQVFVVAYECQSCKGIPEVFLVRRKGMRLSLSGRAPIEQFKLPSFIPNTQGRFFSGATIAFNSGQVLAANFLLRTFLEQYVRAVTDNAESRDIENVFDQYSQTLPNDFKERFPSLYSIYENLSVDIHSVTGSPEVFGEAKADVERHFDAKRVFEI